MRRTDPSRWMKTEAWALADDLTEHLVQFGQAGRDQAARSEGVDLGGM